MGRFKTCLIMLVTVGTPAAAKQSETARPSDAASAVRLAAAYGVITSTYRTPEHNRAVGGVPNSYHLHGRAIDVARRPGVSHRQIDAALRTAGFNLIESLDEGDHSHFAFGPANAHGTAPALAQNYPLPPAPSKPAPPRLLADEHGTLVIDLAKTPTVASGTN